MKFTTSWNKTKPWFDYDLETEEACIEKYFRRHLKVFDADICGHEVLEFVFENGNAYQLDYSWWIEYNPEWELKELYELTELELSEIENCETKYRDWL